MAILFVEVNVWRLFSEAVKANYLWRYEVRLTDDQGKSYPYEVS